MTWRIRQARERETSRSATGEPVDHVELFGPPLDAANHSRNFVLCPGKAYDRSPCGTGTSAKLACLFADGKLKPGDVWRQESITGSVFEGRVEATGEPGAVIPSITGTAFITAETTLMVDPEDPLLEGIRQQLPASTSSGCRASRPVRSRIWWRHEVPVATTVAAGSAFTAGTSARFAIFTLTS